MLNAVWYTKAWQRLKLNTIWNNKTKQIPKHIMAIKAQCNVFEIKMVQVFLAQNALATQQILWNTSCGIDKNINIVDKLNARTQKHIYLHIAVLIQYAQISMHKKNIIIASNCTLIISLNCSCLINYSPFSCTDGAVTITSNQLKYTNKLILNNETTQMMRFYTHQSII